MKATNRRYKHFKPVPQKDRRRVGRAEAVKVGPDRLNRASNETYKPPTNLNITTTCITEHNQQHSGGEDEAGQSCVEGELMRGDGLRFRAVHKMGPNSWPPKTHRNRRGTPSPLASRLRHDWRSRRGCVIAT